jgi:ADP-ribose pyrophosphatase YjhB (NUDIX family)
MNLLAHAHPKFPRFRLGKALSVMAWIEDASGNILLVRQSKDKRLWTLPGGKVRLHEALSPALERELAEEISQSAQTSHIVDIFDRPEKNALCILFRTVLKGTKLRLAKGEIEASMYTSQLPKNVTPSLRYFWQRHFCHKSDTLPAASPTPAKQIALIAA